METLAEALPKEQARVRKVLTLYQDIGEVGQFGAAMIEESLKKADIAASSGDVIAMLAAHQDLKEIEG